MPPAFVTKYSRTIGKLLNLHDISCSKNHHEPASRFREPDPTAHQLDGFALRQQRINAGKALETSFDTRVLSRKKWRERRELQFLIRTREH